MGSVYAEVVALLRERGAAGIDHPGGTLLAHLERVADRLRRQGVDEVVRLAALAHAVYGTDGFDTKLLDRKQTWPFLGETRVVHDRWSGDVVRPGPEVLRGFVDLSIVNELDVCEQSSEVKARYGEALLERFRAWRGLGSPSILDDAEGVLGARA